MVNFFRLLLEELVIYIEHCPKASFASQWKNFVHKCPFPLNESFKPKSWKQIYNMNSVNMSLSRIQMVGYNEKIVSNFRHIVDKKITYTEYWNEFFKYMQEVKIQCRSGWNVA